MIEATIVADSVSAVNGKRITTFEINYPRFIHGELMTHRLFSRNAASSRAIPIDKIIEMVENTPAMPVEWGLNQAGMQAKEVHSNPATCEWAWKRAAKRAVESARELQKLGLHKQLVNRVLEPFQIMKTIVTATEFDNFFWLRCHTDAQPEIHVLADKMYEAWLKSCTQTLDVGEWHLPYIHTSISPYDDTTLCYFVHDHEDGNVNHYTEVTLEQAKMISSSCCAQVSYRKLDESLDKATKIYDQLVTMSPVHASPFEHLATPIPPYMDWEPDPMGSMREKLEPRGVTHEDVNGNYWSGNLQGWIQYRQLIDNHTCWNYEE